MKFYIKVFVRFIRHIVSFFQYGRNSYSQEGEDLILNRLFANKDKGFYIDIGAHHPYRFSNTYLFYLNGWTGINIDAMPGSMTPFKSKRPKDINLEVPILDKEGIMTYYQFNEPALNGFPLNYLTTGMIILSKELSTRSTFMDTHFPIF